MWRSEDSVQESVLASYHEDPRDELRSWGLAAAPVLLDLISHRFHGNRKSCIVNLSRVMPDMPGFVVALRPGL